MNTDQNRKDIDTEKKKMDVGEILLRFLQRCGSILIVCYYNVISFIIGNHYKTAMGMSHGKQQYIWYHISLRLVVVLLCIFSVLFAIVVYHLVMDLNGYELLLTKYILWILSVAAIFAALAMRFYEEDSAKDQIIKDRITHAKYKRLKREASE